MEGKRISYYLAGTRNGLDRIVTAARKMGGRGHRRGGRAVVTLTDARISDVALRAGVLPSIYYCDGDDHDAACAGWL